MVRESEGINALSPLVVADPDFDLELTGTSTSIREPHLTRFGTLTTIPERGSRARGLLHAKKRSGAKTKLIILHVASPVRQVRFSTGFLRLPGDPRVSSILLVFLPTRGGSGRMPPRLWR